MLRVVVMVWHTTGKSTLLKILCGELEADGGRVDIAESVKIGFVRSTVLAMTYLLGE